MIMEGDRLSTWVNVSCLCDGEKDDCVPTGERRLQDAVCDVYAKGQNV